MNHISKYCDEDGIILESFGYTSWIPHFVEIFNDIALLFMFNENEIMKLVDLIDKFSILRGNFLDCQSTNGFIQGVYDVTDFD